MKGKRKRKEFWTCTYIYIYICIRFFDYYIMENTRKVEDQKKK